ncbi:MAG: RDD family protein [Oscillospiraceae bacterium]|nr:RDD family protein [Oscillospiraceae bacterium]
MDNNPQTADTGKRIIAFIIDHILLSFVLVLGFIIVSWESILNNPDEVLRLSPLFLTIVFLCFCLKDIVGGASFGKRALGLAVRCSDDNSVTPHLGKLFLRNILSCLWFVELLMILVGKDKKKIGDILAKTNVYSISNKVKPTAIIFAGLSLVLVFVISLLFGVTAIMKSDDSYKTAISYIEENSEIKSIVGGITRYGFFITGNVSYTGEDGSADFLIKVIGEKRSLTVKISLEKSPDTEWTVIDISY